VLFILWLIAVREKLSLDRDQEIATTSLCVSLICPVSYIQSRLNCPALLLCIISNC